MVGNKKNIRLFKVAKELNVSTSMLVEHLDGNGHSVADSPNTKLSGEQYDILLKEFASEKMIKQQAEQLSERRREELKTVTAKPEEPAKPVVTATEPEKELISAEQLRNRISSPAPEKKSDPTPAPPVAKEPPVTPVQKADPAPAPEEKKPEPPASDDGPALKVLGKIDLDALNSPSSRKTKQQPKKAEAKKVAPVKETPKPVQPPKPEPKIEKEVPKEKPVEKPVPVAKKAEAPKPEPKPVAKPKVEEPKVEEPATTTEEDHKTITAGDNTPQLSGLKVMGKIDLPGSKPKKDANSSSSDGDEEKDPSKKRRRRRRKRKGGTGSTTGTTQTSTTDNKSGNRRGSGVKKEKPTQKEVDKSIKDTLNQMGRSASRSRQKLRRAKRDSDAVRRDTEALIAAEEEKVISVTEFITANEFADLLDVHVNDIIKKSFELGMMISINQRLDAELMTIIAEEYGYIINFVDVTDEEIDIEEIEDAPEDLEKRTPIVTVMGHVDHGKTTLLDNLRKANVAAGEAGGITQHIGAYEVNVDTENQVTFLDTPGHEAFTAMRARGAKVTDVAIIVISADDAVMPQTKEAINHSEAAGVSMVFAINKIDKDGAEPEKIKAQLAEMNYLLEDWGGKYQSQEISALKGIGVEDLLEKVILEAEILELKANDNRTAVGTVIEARLDKGRGNVATVLVQNGTLKVGDEVVAGIHYGKVRAMIDQNGNRVKEAGPSKPVQLLGLGGSPQAGDKFHVFTEDGKAKNIAQRRQELFRQQQFRQTKRITLEEIGRRRAIGNFKELNVIIRGDVDGSVEALSGSLMKLSTEEVQVNIIAKGNGAITEADVNLAIASDAVLMAFNVRPNAQARNLAEREEVDIRTYSVIYDAINDVRDALEGLLSPEIKEEEMGTAEILEIFRITKVGIVAGGMVKSGKIKREDPVRVIRDGVVIYSSKLSSLKRFKDDAKEVFPGQEFGFTVENYPDLKAGDIIESYHVNEIRRKL